MKRKLMLIALVMGIISTISFGSLAYFTAEERAHNIITSGSVAIDLEELTDQLDQEGAAIPFEDLHGVMPGTRVSKIVQVTNTGTAEAFLRVRVDVAIILQDGVTGEVDLSLITIDYNLEQWTDGEDGYYYYNEPLAPGETTVPLFTTVAFADTMGNLYQNSTALVDVEAYAVQTANNGPTVFDARGWPEAQVEV